MAIIVPRAQPVGFGMLFVEFNEYVVAVDAHTGWYEMNQLPPMNWSHGDAIDALGRKFLAAIRQTIPYKPVRYVILTHHHSDHIGGILPFIDAGAKIVAGENAAYMVKIAVAGRKDHSEKPDLTPDDDYLEIVSDVYIISDGEMSMKMIELPDGNPKADNYLMVYLPEYKLLYSTAFIYPIPESLFRPNSRSRYRTADECEVRHYSKGTFMGDHLISGYRDVCAAWNVAELPASWWSPVRSDLPVLIISGERDPVTPPSWGDAVAEYLPNSLHVVVPGGGHVPWNDCLRSLERRYLAQAAVTDLDTSCTSGWNHSRAD